MSSESRRTALLVLLALAACLAPGPAVLSARQSVMLALTQLDQGKSFTVKAGDTVSLTLAEAPTTGFRWSVAGNGAGILDLVNSSYDPPAGSGIGGTGKRTWTFKAEREGSVQLSLTRGRRFEPSSAAERFDVTIQVVH